MTEVVLRIRLDRDATVEVERYRDIAERPVVAVKSLDIDAARIGDAVLALLRAAVDTNEKDR